MNTARLFLLLLCVTTWLRAEEILVPIGEWPPFIGKSMPNKGLSTYIVTNALEQAGHKANIQSISWTRALAMAKSGTPMVIPAIWYTSEREEYLRFSRHYLTSQLVFVSPAARPYQFDSKEHTLDGKRIALVKGFAYPQDLRTRWLPHSHIHEVSSLEETLQALLSGKIDVTISDNLVAHYHATRMFGKEPLIYIDPHPILEKQVFIAISRTTADSKNILRKINHTIDDVLNRGYLSEALDRYIEGY